MSGARAFVPRALDYVLEVSRIVIGFYIVGCIIAILAQEGGEALHVRGQGKTRSHLMGPKGRGVCPVDQAGARRRADRRGCKGICIADALFGQGIDVRSNGIRMSVASENWTHILGGNPEDVGFAEGEKRREKKQDGQGEPRR